VVVNLYPFGDIISKEDVSLDEVIENIDIGGPCMLRAASKNYKGVAAVSSSCMYNSILEELRNNRGKISDSMLFELATKTFKLTCEYDNLIARYLGNQVGEEVSFPEDLSCDFSKVFDLRYGENPHQKASFYKDLNEDKKFGIPYVEKLHGRDLSYNNILDLDVAFKSCTEFNNPAASIIKHASPCGVAVDNDIIIAFENAYACDQLSSFGSIVGFNRKVNKEIAESISKKFIECIIAPDYEKDALDLLKLKKNIRILKSNNVAAVNPNAFDFKKVSGGVLIQDQNIIPLKKEDIKVVTKKSPTDEEIESMLFAWSVVKYVKSNAIVIADAKSTVGIGAGQPSRVDAVKIAIDKAGQKASGSSLASDAFFPVEDSIEVASLGGIKSIIQPGGSIKDKDVIKKANDLGISMVFTGVREFRH